MKKFPIDEKWIKGAVSLKDGVMPYRLPYDQIELFDSGLAERAACAAGVRVMFETDSSVVELLVQSADENRAFDLVIGEEWLETNILPAGQNHLRFSLPAGMKEVAVYLPQRFPVVLESIRVNDDAVIRESGKSRKKWITYGSSITQCGTAGSPAHTWPAMVSRAKDWELTCLGFGGQCHLEPMVARMIRDLPADIISLCMGINVYGVGSLNRRSFRSAVIGMVMIIREKHKDTPLIMISPIFSPSRETERGRAGMSLHEMREEIEQAYAILTSRGDRHLYYINGLDIFGAQYEAYLPDGTHPNPEGNKRMAEHILEHHVMAGL